MRTGQYVCHFIFVGTAVRDDKEKRRGEVWLPYSVGNVFVAYKFCHIFFVPAPRQYKTFLFVHVETVRHSEKVLRTLKVFFISFYDFVLAIFRSDKYWASCIRGCFLSLLCLQNKVSRRVFSVSYEHENVVLSVGWLQSSVVQRYDDFWYTFSLTDVHEQFCCGTGLQYSVIFGVFVCCISFLFTFLLFFIFA